jgi:hypothetical protein
MLSLLYSKINKISFSFRYLQLVQDVLALEGSICDVHWIALGLIDNQLKFYQHARHHSHSRLPPSSTKAYSIQCLKERKTSNVHPATYTPHPLQTTG